MAAATTDRNTRSKLGSRRTLPVAATTLIYAGTIACVFTSGGSVGLLTKGATATNLKALGVATGRIDNAAGAASAIRGEVEVGVQGPFGNSASSDLIAAKDIGADCFIVDDQTVALTNGGNTRSIAGKVWDVDAEGVWVLFQT
ncbi:MAG: hypothetical protein ACKVQR_15035 [Aquabacterium sp.]